MAAIPAPDLELKKLVNLIGAVAPPAFKNVFFHLSLNKEGITTDEQSGIPECFVTWKAFQELQSKMVDTQRKLRLADMQIESHCISIRKSNIANSVISSYPADTRMYDSVGRMFLLSNKKAAKAKLEARNKAAEDRINQLMFNKTYLESELRESKDNLRELVATKKAAA